jgi:hypothetical protein
MKKMWRSSLEIYLLGRKCWKTKLENRTTLHWTYYYHYEFGLVKGYTICFSFITDSLSCRIWLRNLFSFFVQWRSICWYDFLELYFASRFV